MAHLFESDDWLKLADNSALTLPGGNWSLGGWIKVNSNDIGNNYQRVFEWGVYGASPSCTLYLYGEGAAQADKGLFRVKDSDGDGDWEYTDGTTFGATRDWQHFLVVRNGTIFTVYLDNVSHGTGDATNMDAVDVAVKSWTFGNRIYNDFDLAEWAKWDSALSSDEIAALLSGVRPVDVGQRPAWYLPMCGGLYEEVAGIALTNTGITESEHPPHVLTAGNIL